MFSVMEVSLKLVLEHWIVEDPSGLDKDFGMAPIVEKKLCGHVRALEMLRVGLFVTELHRAIEVPHVSHKEAELQLARTVSFGVIFSGFF